MILLKYFASKNVEINCSEGLERENQSIWRSNLLTSKLKLHVIKLLRVSKNSSLSCDRCYFLRTFTTLCFFTDDLLRKGISWFFFFIFEHLNEMKTSNFKIHSGRCFSNFPFWFFRNLFEIFNFL